MGQLYHQWVRRSDGLIVSQNATGLNSTNNPRRYNLISCFSTKGRPFNVYHSKIIGMRDWNSRHNESLFFPYLKQVALRVAE